MGPRVTASSASTRSSRNAWPDGRQKSERPSERSSRAVHRSRSATSRGSSRTCGSLSLGRVEPELLLASEPRHVLVEPRARLRRHVDPELRTDVHVAVGPGTGQRRPGREVDVTQWRDPGETQSELELAHGTGCQAGPPPSSVTCRSSLPSAFITVRPPGKVSLSNPTNARLVPSGDQVRLGAPPMQ